MPVTERALKQRINRRLEKQGEVLKTLRGDRWYTDLGRHYILNIDHSFVVAGHIDLEKLGRELGAMAPYERLEDPK